MEDAYRSDKANFLELPYWTSDFVGTGPYKLRQWNPGVGLSLEANPDRIIAGQTYAIPAPVAAVDAQAERALVPVDRALDVRDRQVHGAELQCRRQCGCLGHAV
jgi:hypothetical protein